MTWLRGDWMQTFTGRQFFPVAPHAEDIDPADVAHALGMICRYGGHTTRFYSVAEHCVLMSRAVSEENAAWALLHDATEAYVGDMVRPLKHQPQMAPYREIEDRLMTVIAQRFGLVGDTIPEEVHSVDTRILLDERATVLRPTGHQWSTDGVEPLGVEIQGWSPSTAEAHYVLRLTELGLS
jgi:hypothetical protein